jgi:hypothetical protein
MLEMEMMQREWPSKTASAQAGQDPSKTKPPRPDLDEVNDASFDSFPASDPPSWSSMIAGAPRLRL